jgi:DNA-binding HxlR family transcriptional regulator
MLSESKVKVSKRSYREFCGVAKALDVIGERWTLLIVRNLLVGGQRYKDLVDTLPGITTNLLAARLRELGKAGLVAQRELPPPAASTIYELTPAGRELEAVVFALGQFGARYMLGKPPGRNEHTHIRWMMVALKRRYRGSERASVLSMQADEHEFRLRLGPRSLEIDSGPALAGDEARVRLESTALRGILFEGVSAQGLIARGRIEVEGNREAFLDLVRAVGGTL